MELKISVVDDNELDLLIAGKVISICSETITVKTYNSAQVLLNEMEESAESLPDLILLDIRMPELDGFGFLEKFSNLPDQVRQRVKIIMLSSSTDTADISRSKKYPWVKGYLVKPLNRDSLQVLLRELFP